jgi:hypothetical protein
LAKPGQGDHGSCPARYPFNPAAHDLLQTRRPQIIRPQSVSLNTKPKQHTAHLLLLQWEPFGAILAGGAAARSGLARHPLGRPLKTGGSDRSESFEFENL